jgi:radical SAM protein with 4Fe4S-binding SPASM domain
MEELPLAEITKTVHEASDMIKAWSDRFRISFTPSMNITGGEPFLRHDLFDILQAVKEAGFEVSLLTNGTLVNGLRARKLAGIGVDGVQVSMEGPEDIHDAIRGTGSFAATTAGVRHLVDCGLDVTLNVTISSLNAQHVRKVIDFGSRAGVKRVGFSRLVPSGKGSAMISQMLSKRELRDLYAALLAPGSKSPGIVTGDPIASRMKRPADGDAGAIPVSGCAAGISGLTIQSNGDIVPCRRLPLCLGNVRKDSLREVWATSPVLEALRDRSRYEGKCGACARWAVCRGCRAIAYAWSLARGEGDFLADDPQCFLVN